MLIFSVIPILTSIAVNNKRDITIVYNRIITLVLIFSLYILYINKHNLLKGIILFNGLFYLENYNFFFISFILILSSFIILLTSFIPRNVEQDNSNNKNKVFSYKNFNIEKILNRMISNETSEQYRIGEYPLILVFCILGTIFLISSSDIISIFLAIELQSYSLYLVSAIYRNSENSVSASLMYFLLGSLSSCIILLGIALLYIYIGNTNLENIFIVNNIVSIQNNYFDNTDLLFGYIFTQYFYIQIAFTIISVGFLFKISAAPFHFWSPDVYNAIPTLVTTFVSIIPKISILMLFYNFMTYSTGEYISWYNSILLSVILSLIIGSILGLTQYKIKRLYAYSTISHLGFILLSLSINNYESAKAFFFYLIQYSVSNLNAFIILISIGYTMYIYTNNNNNIKDSINSPIQYIHQLKGYFYINPIMSISLIITLFSFIGIPPMIGFFGKQMILNIAIYQNFIFITILAIITSTISAVYYLVIVKSLFFNNIELKKNKLEIIKKNTGANYNINLSNYYTLIISILTLLILLYILYDKEFVNLVYSI